MGRASVSWGSRGLQYVALTGVWWVAEEEGSVCESGLSPLGAMIRSGEGKGASGRCDEMGWGTPNGL